MNGVTANTHVLLPKTVGLNCVALHSVSFLSGLGSRSVPSARHSTSSRPAAFVPSLCVSQKTGPLESPVTLCPPPRFKSSFCFLSVVFQLLVNGRALGPASLRGRKRRAPALTSCPRLSHVALQEEFPSGHQLVLEMGEVHSGPNALKVFLSDN